MVSASNNILKRSEFPAICDLSDVSTILHKNQCFHRSGNCPCSCYLWLATRIWMQEKKIKTNTVFKITEIEEIEERKGGRKIFKSEKSLRVLNRVVLWVWKCGFFRNTQRGFVLFTEFSMFVDKLCINFSCRLEFWQILNLAWPSIRVRA